MDIKGQQIFDKEAKKYFNQHKEHNNYTSVPPIEKKHIKSYKPV